MRKNLIHKHEQNQAQAYLDKLIDKKALIELKEIRTNLSNQFNGYLHVCISFIAQELTRSLEYVKQVVFKQKINPDIYVKNVKDKQGSTYIYLLSITNPDVDNVSALNKFIVEMAKEGFVCPDPDDRHFIAEILKNEYILKKQGLV